MNRTVILKGGPLSGETVSIAVEERRYSIIGIFGDGRHRFTWEQRDDDNPHIFDYIGHEYWTTDPQTGVMGYVLDRVPEKD